MLRGSSGRRVLGALLAGCSFVCVGGVGRAQASGPLTWSAPRLVDASVRVVDPIGAINGIACATPTLCVAVGSLGAAAVSSDPADPKSWIGKEPQRAVTLTGISCTSAPLCAIAGSEGTLDTASQLTGRYPWQENSAVKTANAVACVDPGSCFAVGDTDFDQYQPVAPTYNHWTSSAVPGAQHLDGISCPTPTFCVVTDTAGRIDSLTGFDTNSLPTWNSVDVSSLTDDLTAISCSSPTSCVAADATGDVLTTSTPTGPASVWTLTNVDGTHRLTAISCITGGACVATDDAGNVLSSTNPSGGKFAWTVTAGVDSSALESVFCESATLCMVGDQQGRVGVSTTPWSPSPSWTFGDPIGTGTARAALNDVTCHGTHLCVAVDGSGYAVSTTAPSGPASGWKVTPISPGHSVAGVSCPAVSLCVAVADRSRVATTSHPAGSWHVDDLALSSADYEEGGQYPDTLGPISCASASLCVADRGTFSGPTVELLRNLSPSHFTASGKVLGAPKSEFVTAACPSAQLCLTVGDAGAEVDTSTDDAQHWKQHVVVPPHLQNGSLTPAPTAASCPSASFCALVDDRGYVLTSHHPTGGYREWNRVRLHGASEMYGVSCASTKLCVAIDKKGHVYTSTHPTRGTSAWKSSTLSPTLTAVACASNRLCVIATNDGHVVVGH